MNYTEQYVKEILQKVINDLDEWRGYESYYDKEIPFKAYYHDNKKNLYNKSIIKHIWIVKATVPKDGWKGGFIIVNVSDDTGKAITYMNSALGGRPITLPLETDKNGTYFIPPDALPQ